MFLFMQPTAGNEPNRQDHGDQTEQRTPDHPPHRHRRWLSVVQTLTLITALLLATYNHALIGASPTNTTATPWLVESEPFDALAPCNEGGFRIHTGFDVNGNTVLDAGERQDTTVLCHGLRGLLARKAKPVIPVRTQRCSSWQPNSCPSRTPPARMAGCWCAAGSTTTKTMNLTAMRSCRKPLFATVPSGATVSTAPTARRVQEHSSTK